MQEMKERYKCKVGFSDHTPGLSAPIAAATLGASVIEKHLTFSKKMYGSDAKNSFEPKEFKFLVDEIKKLVKALKFKLNKNNLDKKIEAMRYTFQKSIVASKDLKNGHKIEIKDLAYKKPGDGLAPEFYKELIGKILKKDIIKDDIIKFEELE